MKLPTSVIEIQLIRCLPPVICEKKKKKHTGGGRRRHTHTKKHYRIDLIIPRKMSNTYFLANVGFFFNN